MHQQNIKKSAVTKGLSYGLFAGTATYSAFVLPALIYSLLGNSLFDQNNRLLSLPIWAQKVIFAVTIFCALYHSLYRVKTVAFDLGYSPRTVKITAYVANFFLLTGIAAIMALLIIR